MTEPTGPTEPNQPPSPPSGPTWRPPHSQEGNAATVLVGLVLLVIGVWYFLDQTLGLEMPRVRWADLWPLILIFIGGAMLFRSVGRQN